MALTVSIVDTGVMGDYKYTIADITFDSSYLTGGESLTASDLQFPSAVTYVSSEVLRNASTGFVVTKYDYSASKLQAAWDDAPGANAAFIEVDSTTNLAAYTGRFYCLGK